MRRILLLLVLLSVLPGASYGQGTGTALTENVTLQPGDVIRVFIWREEDLSGDFPVDEKGVVTLPLLGTRTVTGMPMGQVRDALIEDYRAQLRNPSITIVPLRRVNILGEVNKPGLYLIDPTISLAGAIAMAQGATPTGNLNRIRIVRDGQVIRRRVGLGESLTTVDVRSGDQIFVDRRGWFERNTPYILTTALSVTGILISIIRTSGGDSGDDRPPVTRQ